jgi:hypothetical protein
MLASNASYGGDRGKATSVRRPGTTGTDIGDDLQMIDDAADFRGYVH